MNCNHSEELLALHAGGDLTLAEAAEVETHVAQCGVCSAELAAYRSARKALVELRTLDAAAGNAGPGDSLWTELDARLAAVDAVERHQRPWYRRSGWISSLAAAAVLTFTVPFAMQNLGSDDLPLDGDGTEVDGATRGGVAEGLIPANKEDFYRLFMPMQSSDLPPGLNSEALSTDAVAQENPDLKKL